MSDGTGEVPMDKLVDGQGKQKRVWGLVWVLESKGIHVFDPYRTVSPLVQSEVKLLTEQDAERVKACLISNFNFLEVMKYIRQHVRL